MPRTSRRDSTPVLEGDLLSQSRPFSACVLVEVIRRDTPLPRVPLKRSVVRPFHLIAQKPERIRPADGPRDRGSQVRFRKRRLRTHASNISS